MSDNEKVSKKDNTKIDALDVLGSSGLNTNGGLIDEEWLPQLRNEKGQKIYTEMRDNDPVVGSILYAIKTLVRQTKSSIQPANDNPKSRQYAEYVEQCIEDMEVSFPDFLSEVLSFLPFGWSYFETLFKVRGGYNKDPKLSSKFSDGQVGWRKFAVRSQDTLFKWEFDDEGGCLGMWQVAPPTYEQVYIPVEKALHFRTETHKNNPEGRSILRNAYRSWFYLKRIQEIEIVGVERDLAGLPIMTVPVELLAANATSAQKAVVDDFRDMIQKIRRDEYDGVVIPSETDIDGNPTGFKLSLLSSGGRRPMDVDGIVKRYESRVALSVLGEFVLVGMDGHGSFALSSNKTALFAKALGTYLQTIEAVFNDQAIAALMKLNGWTDAENYPVLRFSDIETPDVQEISSALTGLVSAGVITPDNELEEWVRDFAGLPISDSATSRMPDVDVQAMMDDAALESYSEIEEKPELEDEENSTETGSDSDSENEAISTETGSDSDSENESDGISTEQRAAPVSAVTLNGAQVSSLLEVIQNVSTGLLPRDSALQIISTAFNLTEDKANSILGSVGRGFTPQVQEDQNDD
tara:strand:+ start:18295 stop:20031 length:1737 start_codon:yes stop_codon:yes gene_type:complete